jgi:hypothetical protein
MQTSVCTSISAEKGNMERIIEKDNPDLRSLFKMSEIEERSGIKQQQVSRWRYYLGNWESYRERLLGAMYKAAAVGLSKGAAEKRGLSENPRIALTEVRIRISLFPKWDDYLSPSCSLTISLPSSFVACQASLNAVIASRHSRANTVRPNMASRIILPIISTISCLRARAALPRNERGRMCLVPSS